MKLTCPISGLSWTVSTPAAGETVHIHPMLSPAMYPHQLNETYLESFAAGKLTDTETYLLALAYITKLPCVELPALKSKHFPKYLPYFVKHMELFAELATKISGVTFADRLPKFRLSEENLGNLHDYLKDLRIAYFSRTVSIDSDAVRKLNKAAREAESFENDHSVQEIILRGLRGSPMRPKEHEKFAQAICNWLEKAAPFPTTTVTDGKGNRTTLAKLWRKILTLTFSSQGAYTLLGTGIKAHDIELLSMHCVDYLDMGSVQAMEVIRNLNETAEVLKDFASPVRKANKVNEVLADPSGPLQTPELSPAELLADPTKPGQPTPEEIRETAEAAKSAMAKLQERMAKIRGAK